MGDEMEEVDSWTIQLHRKTNDLLLVLYMKDGCVKKIPVETVIDKLYSRLMELENETSDEGERV